jgi:hypothetical protein
VEEIERQQNAWGVSGQGVSGSFGTGRCEKIDFAEIWLDAKCMPMAQRSLIGHPGEIFFVAELTPHLFFNFFTSSRRSNPHRSELQDQMEFAWPRPHQEASPPSQTVLN